MKPELLIAILVTFLHNLFTVVWMGGLIVTVISYLPALKKALGAGPEVKKVMQQYQKRQALWVAVSIVGLILTGIMMTHRSTGFTRFFMFDNSYSAILSIKHILVILMIAVALYRSLGLGRKKEPLTPSEEKLNMALLFVNALLAVLVLLASAGIATLV